MPAAFLSAYFTLAHFGEPKTPESVSELSAAMELRGSTEELHDWTMVEEFVSHYALCQFVTSLLH